MVNSADRKAAEQAERQAQDKARRRAEQAAIVTALQQVLEGDENLLGFARGRIAGGWRGKLNVGPEAFFAPYINIGLTDRRIILQHIHPESGKPSEILPHSFPLSDIADFAFSDIETFGAEQAGRFVLRLTSDQSFRIRLTGNNNVENATAMTEVFLSLTDVRRKTAHSPTHHNCSHCGHALDQPFKFCPFCGFRLGQETEAAYAPPVAETVPEVAETPVAENVPVETPQAQETIGETQDVFVGVAPPTVETRIEEIAPQEPTPPTVQTPVAEATPESASSIIEAHVGEPMLQEPTPLTVEAYIEPAPPEAPAPSAVVEAGLPEAAPSTVETPVVEAGLQEPSPVVTESGPEWIDTHYAEANPETDRYEQPTSEPLSETINTQYSQEPSPALLSPTENASPFQPIPVDKPTSGETSGENMPVTYPAQTEDHGERPSAGFDADPTHHDTPLMPEGESNSHGSIS